MQRSQPVLILVAFLAAVTVAQVLDEFNAQKKSNMAEFMSAMNGAGRLRYGKRAAPEAAKFANDDESLFFVQYYPHIVSGPRNMNKRMAQNLPELITSLNGAERLRFGRK